MADIELVIRIDEKLYKDICSDAEIIIYGGMRSGKTLLATLLRAIRNGTPLPKVHGDLIDINELNLFAEEHEIGNNAYDGKLIYNAGETSRHDTIWKPLSDVLNVIIKVDKDKISAEEESEEYNIYGDTE